MNKVRLSIVALMILCLLPAALFASGESEKSGEAGVTKKVTVTQWSFPLTGEARDEFTGMEAAFEEANPNIEVNIEFFPTHIAGMPVAVNVCCHAARHGEAVL